MSKLEISPTLALPVDAVTQAIAFLGRRRSGKTYAAMKLFELMYAAGAQAIALDGVGVWWGLRLGADGKSKGLDVPIFGGLHGDVPLEASAGALIADLVVDRGLSAVVDVSQFEHDTDRARFAKDFGKRFFFRKTSAPSAVHVFVEEAQEWVPQNPQKGEEHMLHAYQRIVRLGGNYGIGMSLISQRPQDVNKKALNQAECIFAFQLTGTHERKAVQDWFSEKGLDVALSESLPDLHQGHAHVWSPVWLNVNKEVAIGRRETFAAGSTPKVGQTARIHRPLAPIDIENLKGEMSASIEKAKADDPKALRAEIADLRRKLDAAGRAPAAKPAAPSGVDRAAVERAVTSAVAKTASEAGREFSKIIKPTRAAMDRAAAAMERAAAELRGALPAESVTLKVSADLPAPASEPHARTAPRPPLSGQTAGARAEKRTGGSTLPAMHRAMLAALAQHPLGLTKAQVRLHSGYADSGPVSTAFAEFARNGWTSGDGKLVRITAAGVDALGSYEPLPMGSELLAFLLSGHKLSKVEKALLRVAADAGGESLRKGEVRERAHYADSGPVSTAFARLLRYGYLEQTGSGQVRAAKELFD